MQAMSTEQQIHYQNSTGSHQPTPAYFIQNEHVMRNPNAYGQQTRMQQPYFTTPLPGTYVHPHSSVYYSHYTAPSMMPTNGSRGTPVHMVRPPNEGPSIGPGYISTGAYSSYQTITNGLSPTSNPYTPPQYTTYSQGPANHIVNPQVPFSGPSNSRQTPISAQNDQQQAPSSQPTQASGKREKKPLQIVNPVSMETVEVTTSTATSTAITHSNADDQCPGDSTTELTSTIKKSIKNTDTTQKQTAFRHDFARLLADSNSQTEKNISASPTEEPAEIVLPKEELTHIITPPSDSTYQLASTNVNRELNPTKLSDQPQPILPVIRPSEKQSDLPSSHDDNKTEQLKIDLNDPTETIVINSNISYDDTPSRPNDDKADVPSPEDPLSPSSSDANVTDQSTSSRKSSLSDVVPLPNPPQSEPKSINKTSSISKRAAYTIQELLKKRTDPMAQTRPSNLKYIEGVTKPPSYGHEPSVPTRGSICLEQPALVHRVANPYVPADRSRIDANDKFIRDVTSILNKLTPQTYDKLVQDLDGLELNSDHRLDGMIRIIFSKAVDEPAFCSLYAKLCQHFQRKQVTVPNADGEMIKYFFRQILLTRCQKEFENDYRQEIEYDKRQKDVEEIKDDKIRKDAEEKLDEDLHKAKRKKLGNIFFIGELFKVQMLTAPIMYECVEYLLRDKTDEESLECLCRLLRTIGKELDANKAGEKTPNRVNLEKNYRELEAITTQRTASSRIRFMIQDLMEQRKAAWVARRAEVKPLTIDEIHEQERIKREEQERDRQQRRDYHRGSLSQQPYGESRGSRGSRGSGMKQQSNRTDDDRGEHRFDVNAVRQLQSNDKINQGTMSLNLAPPRAWSKGSGVDKKTEENRSSAARKPPAMPAQNSKTKTPYPGNPGYAVQHQPSRELARGSSQRDRENAIDSVRKITNGPGGITSPNGVSSTNSPESSRNTSREQSRNASRDSSMSDRKSSVNTAAVSNKKLTSSLSTDSTTMNKTNASNATFDEEKTQARVHALIEEYIENYSDTTDRPVNEAIEDVSDFCTSNVDHQAIIVRELFSNVFEAKPRARKAVGHLLDVAVHKEILSEQGMLVGFKLIIELAPDFAVDIPLIWQYIAEIIGAFISAPSSNISLIKPILQSLPDDKSKQFFQSVIRSATEFSSKSRIQQVWSSSGLSFDDLFRSDLIDSSFTNEYDWLSEAEASKDKLSPCADTKLVKLFKSVNDPGSVVTDEEIIKYIHQNMNATDKFYIRNIVLSYLQACLISRESQKKIQEDIARSRITILNTIIEHKPAAEIQAVYAIQNFVHKLEHPYKMAQLLFDMFYDEECVSEDAFFDWLKSPDQSETEGHSVVEMSTKDFFVWLQQADEEES